MLRFMLKFFVIHVKDKFIKQAKKWMFMNITTLFVVYTTNVPLKNHVFVFTYFNHYFIFRKQLNTCYHLDCMLRIVVLPLRYQQQLYLKYKWAVISFRYLDCVKACCIRHRKIYVNQFCLASGLFLYGKENDTVFLDQVQSREKQNKNIFCNVQACTVPAAHFYLCFYPLVAP